MKKLLLIIAVVMITASCSTTKVGQTFKAAIDVRLPKDSITGKPIEFSHATIRQQWVAIDTFYTTLQALATLADNSGDTRKNFDLVHSALALAIDQVPPTGYYAGISSPSTRALWLKVNSSIVLAQILIKDLPKNTTDFVENFRKMLDYIVLGSITAMNFYTDWPYAVGALTAK